MKKLITLCSFCFTLMMASAIFGTQTSCQKNTTCQVNILIVDTTGTHGVQVPVEGAIVKLYANITPPGQVQALGATDNTGHVTYTFQLPAIFDIQASGTVNVSGTPTSMSGTGLIQLVVGGTATQTVIIH